MSKSENRVLLPGDIASGKVLRKMKPEDFNKKLSNRVMRSSVVLPSQHNAYAVCVEFAKEWFLEKFDPQYFNSVYVEGSHSFDEFRKLSQINQQLKRTNPICAIIPVIDMNANRDWIDSHPEIPHLLKRTRMDGTFFSDNRSNRGLHLQLDFKTITLNVTYKIRLNTRAEEMDMMNFLHVKHRAGWTETRNLELDVHVPKAIISQMAFDNAIPMDANGEPKDPIQMLNYLNSFSLIPFIYKLRCATGNSEYFIKVPNCVAHIKTELPSMDDGERQDMVTTNYNIDFNAEFQMTAPYAYTYYSQHEHNYFTGEPVVMADESICLMTAIKAEIPPEDDNHWGLLTKEPIQYHLDEEEFERCKHNPEEEIKIDMKKVLADDDLGHVMDYTHRIGLAPAVFMNFLVLNNGMWMKYDVDWFNMIISVKGITHPVIAIAIYVDMKYINDALIYIKGLKDSPSRIY